MPKLLQQLGNPDLRTPPFDKVLDFVVTLRSYVLLYPNYTREES